MILFFSTKCACAAGKSKKWFILTTEFLCYTEYPYQKDIYRYNQNVNRDQDISPYASISRQSVQNNTVLRTSINEKKGSKRHDFQLKEVLLID